MKYQIPFALFLLGFFLLGCTSGKPNLDSGPQFSSNKNNTQKPIVILGVHPLHNPERMLEVFGPMVDLLNEKIPSVQFQLESSRDYTDFNQKLYSKKFEFALPNPYQTIRAMDKGYRVFGKMGDDQNFKGIVLVRKDSGILKLSDLKNKTISYPAATALAASMMPQLYMHKHGLNMKTDVTNKYVGSQESSILSVFTKQSDAAATWPPPWRALIKERPEIQEQVVILFETPHLVNNSLMVREDVDVNLLAQVEATLFGMSNTDLGRKILERMELSKFEKAENKTYEAIGQFVKDYNKSLGPVE